MTAPETRPSLHTLVFDWGGTLMANQPDQSGPMMNWPDVSAVEGVHAALSSLQDRYHLVVATNAADSRSREVRAALARVGLDRYFEAIFTSGELGSRKPDPHFFQALQSVLGLEPAQLVMIGDDYRLDIQGARLAGWRAILYNPGCKPAPGLLPLQDAEVMHLSALPKLLEMPFLPDYPTSLSWLQEQPVSYNLLAHVHSVAAAAYQMALWLRAAGQPADPILAHRAALLHDLAKLKALERPASQRIGHAELAALMLADRGQPLLAECARRHPLFSILQPETSPRSWEEKLVYFADKLVEGPRIAGLEERLASLRQRYPSDSQKIAAMAPALFNMQDAFCAAAGLSPSDLIPRLKAAFHS